MRSLVLSPALATMFITAPVTAETPVAAPPPMGWHSWNHFAWKVTGTDVRAAADAMVSSGMRAVGYVYINIDDTRRGKRGPDSAPLPVATPWLARDEQRDRDNASQTFFGQQRNPRYTGFCTRSSLAGSSNTTRRPPPSARGSA